MSNGNKDVEQHPRSSCYFCMVDGPLESHHIVPNRFGGSDGEENLVDLCPTCHQKLERLYDKRFYNELDVEKEQSVKNQFGETEKSWFIRTLENLYMDRLKLCLHSLDYEIEKGVGVIPYKQVKNQWVAGKGTVDPDKKSLEWIHRLTNEIGLLTKTYSHDFGTDRYISLDENSQKRLNEFASDTNGVSEWMFRRKDTTPLHYLPTAHRDKIRGKSRSDKRDFIKTYISCREVETHEAIPFDELKDVFVDGDSYTENMFMQHIKKMKRGNDVGERVYGEVYVK